MVKNEMGRTEKGGGVFGNGLDKLTFTSTWDSFGRRNGVANSELLMQNDREVLSFCEVSFL